MQALTKPISLILLLLGFSIPLSTSLTSVLFCLFILAWILEGNYNNKANYAWQHPACFFSIILLISIAIGSLYSLASWPEIINYLKKMLKLIYVPFLIYYFSQQSQRNWTINALITAGIITAIIGTIYGTYNPFKNSIDTSLIITITTFLLLHKIDLKNKLYINYSILLLILFNVFYLLYFSIGRTSQIIFLLLLILFFIQKITVKKQLIVSLSLIIFMLVFCGMFSKRLHHTWYNVIEKYQNYKANPINYDHNSISCRLTFFKNTWVLIKQKPWLGWGTGSFIPIYKQQFSETNTTVLPNNPHNEYLLWWSQLGLVGVSLLLWWFYILFKASFIIPNYEKYILQGTILTMIVGCLANSWVMDFVSGHLFIMLIAISLGALPNVRSKPNHQSA